VKREFSAGGIIFRTVRSEGSGDSQVLNNLGQVLLINNEALKDPTKSYWGFPKGHLNSGEKSQDAAVREVKEETGLEVEIVEKIGDHKYVFTFQGEKIFKVVTMFLMKLTGGELKIQTDELLDAQWFEVEEALKKLSFSQDKAMLKKALELKNGQ
jgi:8-oxo-dGTP diphosphatase